jgi:hypothetical protein
VCRLQFELSSRLERERLEASLIEATAAKQRSSDQLAAAQQVTDMHTRFAQGFLQMSVYSADPWSCLLSA